VTDTELRDLCHRFFDVFERADVDTIAAIYAPLRASYEGQRRRTYNDRIINTSKAASCSNTRYPSLTRTVSSDLDTCFIGFMRDGKISRAYEYFDTGRIDKPRTPGRRPPDACSVGDRFTFCKRMDLTR